MLELKLAGLQALAAWAGLNIGFCCNKDFSFNRRAFKTDTPRFKLIEVAEDCQYPVDNHFLGERIAPIQR